MSLSDYKNILPKYTALAIQRRGEVINQTIQLERIMDSFIASHFCSDSERKIELMLILLGGEKITFENKRLILKWIVDRHHPTFNKTFPNLIKNMQKIGEFRNLLAHNLLDINDFVENEKQKKIVLRTYKKQIILEPITDEQFKEKIDEINHYCSAIAHWNSPPHFPL